MPGGLTLLQSAPADIPSPGANKNTLFIDNTVSPPAPAYKDSLGVTRPLVGSAGATGAAGPIGPMFPLDDGPQGEDGIPGPPGPTGASAPASTVVFAKIQLTELQLESLNSTPIALVAAQGAGKTVLLMFLAVECVVTTGYSSTPNWSVVWGTNATNLLSTTFQVPLNLTGTYLRTTTPNSAIALTYATFDPTNKAVNIKMDANPSNPGTGVATATVHVAYMISTTP